MIEKRLPLSTEVNHEEARPTGLLQVVMRRRWYFLGPFFALGLLGYVIANLIPLKYRSSAVIIVEQRKVPDQYVLPNVLMTLQKRLDEMTQQILSRTRLQRFIEDFGLYASERNKKSMDDIIDTMQKRISVELVKTPTGQAAGKPGDLTGFQITFADPNPYMAQRVTNELTSLFIEQDARERTSQSQATTAFLESQLEQGRKQLAEEEEKLHQYKLSHLGELPDQQQTNLTILGSLQAQLQASSAALDRAEQQRIYFESMRLQQQTLNVASAASSGPSAPAGDSPGDGQASGGIPARISLETAQATVADLWKELRELTARYTGRHPEITRLKREIADWEGVVDRLSRERQAMAELNSRLKAVLAEIESERRENANLRRQIKEVQKQLGQTPIREQEMTTLTRLYEGAKANVQSLMQKKQGSELASNLEERQGGERFRLLDPATLPKKPDGRKKIVMAGWGIAAALGAGLVFLLDLLDGTVHKPADMEPYAWLPVLAKIPTLRTPQEEKQLRKKRRLEVAAVTVMAVAAIASGAHTYLQG
jgi:polysaccharide chain length determinant protein (PEP-CTERM system associated)